MPMFAAASKLAATSSLATSAALLLLLALQYPIQTSFPIGGDAIRYISRAQAKDVKTLVSNSNYPGTTILVAVSHKLLPLSWPELFTWWIVAAHILTGLALTTLVFRLGGWPASAAALAFWALATTSVNYHFEDGTLAQLLSLPFLLGALERLHQRAYLACAALIVIGFFIHPLSSLLVLAALATALAPKLFSSKKSLLTVVVLIVAGVVAALQTHAPLIDDVMPEDRGFELLNLLHSHFGPALVIAPLGLILLAKRSRHDPLTSATLLTLSYLSLLLTYNDKLGIALFTHRFQTYLIVVITLLAALAFPYILRLALKVAWARTAVAILFFVVLTASAWRTNAAIYHYYESPSRYGRVHDDELAAMTWLKDNVAPSSVIVSSKVNRHSEWIPILSEKTWLGLQETNFVQGQLPENATHAVVFKKREPIPAWLQNHPLVYSNLSAFVFEL